MTAFEFAQTVSQLPAERQNALLARLRDELTEGEYNTTAAFIALYGMFSSPAKYNAMKNAVRDVLWEEFFGHPYVEPERKWVDPCNPVYMTTIV